MKKIPLTKGQFALVDDEDFEFLNQWKWHASVRGELFYACRNRSLKEKMGHMLIYMHRVIINLDRGDKTQIDHKDGNGLNNQRDNLRTCTPSQNRINRIAPTNSTSGLRGVTWSKGRKKWVAQIKIDKKTVNLGGFTSKEDAHQEYIKAAKTYHGEFARYD